MKQIVSGIAAAVAIVVCATCLRSYAGDEAPDARVQQGKLSYDKYCTSCHGANGAPGSAVFPGTNKPVDLRTYAQRNGGTFPSVKWWDITFGSQPGNLHAKVWEQLRKDQKTKYAETDVEREVERDIVGRSVVADIEMYVATIQEKNK